RKRADAALRESEYKLRTLLTSMNEGLLQVDSEDTIVFVNHYFTEMVGYSQEELVGKNWSHLLLDNEKNDFISEVNKRRSSGISDKYELNLKKKSGETLFVMVSGVPILDAQEFITGSMAVFTDITERKRIEEQLLHDAFHDNLTGLANRALFMNHLRLTMERSKSRRSSLYAVLFLDFDRFKIINDSLGHGEGDKLLQFIARRLESATRAGDLVARLGGDEFVVLLSEPLEEGDAVQIAERIQAGLKNPFDLNGNEIFISASIGIALSTSGHKRPEDMLRDADIAMYSAKAKGRARYQIFDQAMHEHASKQLHFETEMRRALENQDFLLHYQPIINLETKMLIGFEALVRWNHAERGLIPPLEFIPAAEENNLILPLGQWILEESCQQLCHWQNQNPAAANLSVSVNLSCRQFAQPDLAEQIAATLKRIGLDPRCLKLEITESQIMENSEKAAIMMNALRALGVELSLDDFGTGYSSLSYLHRLPVNYIKIDSSFVTQMIESEENSEIVQTIIRLAQNLKLKVIAEGIETGEQLAHLQNLNCEYGQGYLFSKPLAAAEAGMLIKKRMEIPDFVTGAPINSYELNM
ncbi:MAG: EAL domain-containing protein, partial [Acidobacteriota bacterium]|nr:EAL domain-containing protein [Acidobacteriota bacterium]